MKSQVSSHEYAEKLKGLAEFLLSRPEFDTDGNPIIYFWYFGDKDRFLSAAHACGSGSKVTNGDDFDFVPEGVPEGVKFFLRANRTAVCRKVQEEKWDCEPLLSHYEEANLGKKPSEPDYAVRP